MNNLFNSFPVESFCPICKTNQDRETLLIPIPGTRDGHLIEAQPTHLDCAGIVARAYVEAMGLND